MSKQETENHFTDEKLDSLLQRVDALRRYL